MERKNHMRKNSKNEKVIRAMAIGISAMLMASSPLTALAAEGEGNSSEGNEDKNITVTPEAGACDQAEAAAKDADKAVEDAEKSAADVKAEVVDKVAAGDVKDAEGKDLSQDILDANAKVEDKTVKDGSSLKDAESAVENADTALGVAEANDKLSDAELNKAADAAANAGQTAAEAKDAMQASQDKVNGQIENIKDAASITDANAAYEEVKTTVDQAQADFDAKLGEYNTAKTAYEEAAQKVAAYEKAYEEAVNSADANAEAAAAELATAKTNAEALAKALEAAKGAVDKSAAGALDIADKETLTQGDNGLNWKNEDQLFISIMQNYYLPEVQKITADDIKVVRRQGEDNNTKNYFEVTYTDENGNKQTKFYNYVMDDKQTSKDNIVIFEKRIEEVNWKTAQETNPDQYVKENGDTITVSEVEKGLKDGTIIAVDGKKVIKNDGTESIIISDNNQKTENGEVDTDVNEATEKESWKLDENGNLIKTVTADVTTITYTDAKFTSTEQYQTEAERDAAAAAKEKDLKDAAGKDVTVTGTEKTDYTYTGNGTYIPTFTKTVNVKDEEVEWKHTDKKTDYGVRTEEEAVAKVTKEQEKALSNKINDDDDLYLIGVSSDLKVTGYTEDHWYDDSDFLVSGTVSATYAKVTKKTVDQSTFGSLWNDIKALFGNGEATNKKLEDAARKAVEAEGGIFVSANWDDWKFGKATIRYVAGVSVKTDEKTSAEEAQNAVQDAALAQAKASGAIGVYNVKTTDTDTIAHTSYSYEIDYLEKTGETTTNTAVRTETYENAEVLTGQIIQNLNYIQGNIKLTQKDTEYRKFVDDAKALTQKYQKLLQDAQDAQKDVETAQAKVNELKAEIEALKSNRTSNLGALKELEGKLAVAEQNKKDAEDILKEILDSLDEAGGELDKAIERLTPAPTPGTPAGGEGETGGAGDTEEGGAGEAAIVVTPVALVAAPAAQATVVAQNQAAAPVVQIADEAAPLAEAAPANTQETVQAGSDKEETKEAVNIEEEAVPLADVAVESEHAKMSWWWWLIILILGATGYEMYKKHNEKKLKAQAENAGDIEE
jgi:mucin-associated surface protein (MASP), putative